jgi:hypothetical protein
MLMTMVSRVRSVSILPCFRVYLFSTFQFRKSYISGGKCPLSPRSCKLAPPRLRRLPHWR